jgi:hypothetical protein
MHYVLDKDCAQCNIPYSALQSSAVTLSLTNNTNNTTNNTTNKTNRIAVSLSLVDAKTCLISVHGQTLLEILPDHTQIAAPSFRLDVGTCFILVLDDRDYHIHLGRHFLVKDPPLPGEGSATSW